jgi:hypothetical protein
MKQLIILSSLLLSFVSAHSQQVANTTIQKGTVLSYTIYPPGLAVNYSFTIDSISANYLSFGWMSESGRVGQFVMNEPSVQRARSGYWLPPQADVVTVADSSQLILCFSAFLWNQLQQTKTAEFDGILFVLKHPPANEQIRINNQTIDALYLESDQGTAIWLLNKPSFPLILKIKNNIAGVDVEIIDIK